MTGSSQGSKKVEFVRLAKINAQIKIIKTNHTQRSSTHLRARKNEFSEVYN